VIGLVVFLVVASAGSALIAMALRATVEEATRLGESVRRIGDLQPALVTIRQESLRAAEAVREMRSR
jgi:hypothetical protein